MKCLVQSLANGSHQKIFISYCFLRIPPFGHATPFLRITHWLSVAYKINFTLLCLRFQGSMWRIHTLCCLYFLEFISVLFLIVLWSTHVLFYLGIFAQDFILSRNHFFLTLPIFKQDTPQINFPHDFPAHFSTWSFSPPLNSFCPWLCTPFTLIFTHILLILIFSCFMSAGLIFPRKW